MSEGAAKSPENINEVNRENCKQVIEEGFKKYRAPVRSWHQLSHIDAKSFPKIQFGETTQDVILNPGEHNIGSITPVIEKMAFQVELKTPEAIANELSTLVLAHYNQQARNDIMDDTLMA